MADGLLVERLRAASARLREVVAAKDGENIGLRAVVAAQELRIAALERRLGMGSDASGTPSSKEPVEARARRRAGRPERVPQRRAWEQDTSSRERWPGRVSGRAARGIRAMV
jgi:hypothetical protein